MNPRVAPLLWHLLLVIALRTLIFQAQSAEIDLDVRKPDFSFHEPLPEDTTRICPLPWCKYCPSAEQIQAPGIGFGLEIGHGYVTLPARLHQTHSAEPETLGQHQ